MHSDRLPAIVRRLKNVSRQTSEGGLAPVRVRAFGQEVTCSAPVPNFLAEDSVWRLRHIYEPALAARILSAEGVALDIGAGFGCFAIPFAKAFPDWTIWCFEPNPDFHAALEKNIAENECANIVPLRLAVGEGDDGGDREALASALKARDANRLEALCPRRKFRAASSKPGFLEAEGRMGGSVRPGSLSYPTIPARALAGLSPTLLKLVAPKREKVILEGLAEAPLDHIIGETWQHVPSPMIYEGPGNRETWLPVAGAPALALRRSSGQQAHRRGLDIVVAMYNAREWITECIESLVATEDTSIRIRVVDDGSTDGCGDLVQEQFGHDRRVIVHRKSNGGCASARNYGRLMSDASHIAFMDSDDVADRDLFPSLLELARYTGAEIVQGGFDLLEKDGKGRWAKRPGPESVDMPAPPEGAPLAHMTVIPATDLIVRQPTIWRRVYRRDFLDNRDIWFPEHIRAFDDLLFQLLSLQHAGDVPTLEHLRISYRQHPGQDIRQGDERGFYALEMFRLALKRGLQEGWNQFAPLLRSYVNTVDWTYDKLRQDLKAPFLQAASELWVAMEKALGPSEFREFPDSTFATEGFQEQADRVRRNLHGIGGSHAFAWLASAMMHADMLKILAARSSEDS